MRYSFLPVLAIGILSFSSCSKSSQPGSTAISYQLKTSNSNVILMRTTSSGAISWTAGFANPTLIKFEAKKDSSEIEFKSINTAQIDLFSSVAASFGAFTPTPGIYTEVELKVDLDNNGSSPALQLSGQFTSGSTTIPVLMQVNEAVEIKTETHDVTIAAGSLFTAVTTLDLTDISTGVTELMLSGASITSGTIVISSTSNAGLYNIIINNLKSHSHHCEFDHH